MNSGGTTYQGLETVRSNSDGSNHWVADVNQYAGIGKGLGLGSDLSLYAVGQFYYSMLKYSRSIPSELVKISSEIPKSFYLEQNYPNPFKPSTKIKYSVSQTLQVQIKVYDVLGNEIATLVDEYKPAGTYELTWNAASLPSGVYFYQLRVGNFVETKKMILMK